MSKKVTMRDIAKELNISVVSVSKALSSREGVSEKVREQIKCKADEMGYVYMNSGAAMTSHNFGAVVSQSYISDNAFYSKLYQNLVIEFGKMNASCMLEIMNHYDERNAVLPNLLMSNKVDGLIILGPLENECLRKIVMTDIPCVLLDTYLVDANVDSVVSDNVYGSHVLTNYLIAKGHKKIAFVGSIEQTNSIMDRYLGYYKSLLINNMPIKEDYLIRDREKDGYIFNEFKLPKDMPDAFVCNCDESAYRLVEYLKKLNYKIPEDISVVGFDDYLYSSICNPQLTTFRVNMEKMGRAAAESMEEKVNNKGYNGSRKVISGDIVIRDSVADRRNMLGKKKGGAF